MDPILKHLNDIFQNPTDENITNSFSPKGFLRFNMIHINPIILKDFKNILTGLGMSNWYLQENGLVFQFNDFILEFRGHLNIFSTIDEDTKIAQPNKQDSSTTDVSNFTFPVIYSLELDFGPVMSSSHNHILQSIESYLKSADSIFFLTYDINTDYEILNNELSKSVDLIAKRIIQRKRIYE